MKDSLQSLLKKEADNLIAFSRDFLSYKRCVLILGAVSLLYILVILFYTHGALLFNGDNYGFYHFSLTLFETPTGVLSGLSLLLSFGNIYIAFYVYLYLSIFIGVLTSFYLSLQILNNFVPREKLKIISLVSASLFVITPYILTDYYSQFINNVTVYSSFFTLFLAFLFRSYSSLNNPSKFLNSIFLAGACLGLSVVLFPMDVRIMLMGYLFFAGTIVFFLFLLYFKSSKITATKIFSSVFIFIITSALFSLFQTYTEIIDIHAFLHMASSFATVYNNNHPGLGLYTGSFNTIPQVIRLVGVWAFPSGYVIYHNIYFGINVVNVASYFWPILAIFFPLVIAYRIRRNRAFLLFIMTLVLASIFWEKGANPPFGTVWYFIISKLPFGYQLLPTGMLQDFFLSKIYPVLSALSIISIYMFLRGRKLFRYRKKLRKLVVLVPVALVIILIVAEMPVFNGQLEENFSNEKTSGFYIPDEYNYARDYLLDSPGKVLLLPGVPSYIQTTWNYQGSSAFYSAFFEPVNIITINNFGGGYGSTGSLNNYTILVSPIILSNSSLIVSTKWLQEAVEYNISYILFDRTISPIFYNYSYYSEAIVILTQKHIITTVLSFKDITIYKVNQSQIREIIIG